MIKSTLDLSRVVIVIRASVAVLAEIVTALMPFNRGISSPGAVAWVITVAELVDFGMDFGIIF